MKCLLCYWVLLVTLSSCNNQYITQKEIRIVDNNGIKTSVCIIKKLRKADRLPVSILTQKQTPQLSFEVLDSVYYNAYGKLNLKKSFVKKNGEWHLTHIIKP